MIETRNYEGAKAFLIARVSDPSQVEALPAQELRLRKYAEELKLNYEMYSFDETAYKDDRRKFQEIVSIIAHCDDAIAVFDKIDRFTRDASSSVYSQVLIHAMRTTVRDRESFIMESIFKKSNLYFRGRKH